MAGQSRQKQRRSIRLKGYDYSQPGAYFVTICAQHGECLFGQVIDGRMQLSEAGRMVQAVWYEIPDHYPGVAVDAFVVMPNHVYGIIVLAGDNVGATPRGRPDGGSIADGEKGQARGPAPTGGLQEETKVVGATPRGRPNGGLAANGEKGKRVRRRTLGPAPTGAELGGGDRDGQVRRTAPSGGRMSLPDVVHRFKSFTTARYRHGVKHAVWPPFPGRLWQRNYWEHSIRDEDALRQIREYIVNNPARWEQDRMHPDSPTNPFTMRET